MTTYILEIDSDACSIAGKAAMQYFKENRQSREIVTFLKVLNDQANGFWEIPDPAELITGKSEKQTNDDMLSHYEQLGFIW